MKYTDVHEIAKRWNISEQRVSDLCREGRIHGAYKSGRVWYIPKDAERPLDARMKEYAVAIISGSGEKLTEYMDSRTAAEKWNVTQQHVLFLCGKGRIRGAYKAGRVWRIPSHAFPPMDARTREYAALKKQKAQKSVIAGYADVSETAKRWDVPERRVTFLCREGRVEGAHKIEKRWYIPSFAECPTDARTKKYAAAEGTKAPEGSTVEYMNVIEAARKWNMTRQRVSVLCHEGRVCGAYKDKRVWRIPSYTERPMDARTKEYAAGEGQKDRTKIAAGYADVRETAQRWGIPEPRVTLLCRNGRVRGAYKSGKRWCIPTDAECPANAKIEEPAGTVNPEDRNGAL